MVGAGHLVSQQGPLPLRQSAALKLTGKLLPYNLRGNIEQGVVELHYRFTAAPVGIEGYRPRSEHHHIPAYLRGQYLPVPVTPAVYRLLHITHYDIPVVFRQAVADEGGEVLPLHA